ncbi:glycosyltransferase [Paenibacillus aurantiacus]|uniref:Glycosyltransferase n=1 Tax=Paenibacillus aurantiacus TaxID=1936118 RepID=A0ABV5KWQ4_9BACL
MSLWGNNVPPWVSIVIPCYNYGEFLEEAIDSCLASTLQDFEIIVVNDGSTDPFTVELLKQLHKPKTRVIHQKNQGVSAALNNGIREARGKYIFRLDADDRIHPTLLEKGTWVMETRPEVGFVTCHLKMFGNESWTWTPPPYSFERLLNENIVIGNSLFRKVAWEQANGFEEQGDGYDDWEFWIKLAAKGWEGFQIPEVLFFYRRHGFTRSAELLTRYEQIKRNMRQKYPDLYQALDQGLLSKGPHPSNMQITDWKYAAHPYATLPVSRQKTRLMLMMPWLIVGGAEKFFLDLIEGLPRELYHITLVTTLRAESPWFERFDSCSDEVFQMPLLFDTPAQMEPLILHLIETRDIQIVHINNSEVGYNMLPRLKSKFPHVKTVSLLHDYVPELAWDHVRHSRQYDNWIDKYTICKASLKQTMQELFQIDPQKIDIVPNGVDTELFRPGTTEEVIALKQVFGIPSDKKVISYIARLNTDKDPLKFISIAQKIIASDTHDRYRFIMVGDGPLRDQVEHAAAPLFPKLLIFGAREDVHSILKITDLLASTSPSEGFPISGLEAMAAAVPVVAFSVRGWVDLIDPNVDGLLIARTSQEEEDFMMQAINLLQHAEWHQSIRSAARNKVLSNYTRHHFILRYRNFYEYLLADIPMQTIDSMEEENDLGLVRDYSFNEANRCGEPYQMPFVLPAGEELQLTNVFLKNIVVGNRIQITGTFGVHNIGADADTVITIRLYREGAHRRELVTEINHTVASHVTGVITFNHAEHGLHPTQNFFMCVLAHGNHVQICNICHLSGVVYA